MAANVHLPSPDDANFPTALAVARQAVGISAAELARRAGISPTMVARYESTTRADRHRPRPHTVTRLERALRGEAVEDLHVEPTALATPSLNGVPLEDLIVELERRGFGITITKLARG